MSLPVRCAKIRTYDEVINCAISLVCHSPNDWFTADEEQLIKKVVSI